MTEFGSDDPGSTPGKSGLRPGEGAAGLEAFVGVRRRSPYGESKGVYACRFLRGPPGEWDANPASLGITHDLEDLELSFRPALVENRRWQPGRCS